MGTLPGSGGASFGSGSVSSGEIGGAVSGVAESNGASGSFWSG